MWREMWPSALMSASLLRGHMSLGALPPLSSVPGEGVSLRQEQLQTEMHRGHANVRGHVWQAAGLWGSLLCREMSPRKLPLLPPDESQVLQMRGQEEGDAVWTEFYLRNQMQKVERLSQAPLQQVRHPNGVADVIFTPKFQEMLH